MPRSARALASRLFASRALASRVLAAFAFVMTVLLPLRASAVIIPTCEHDAVTRMPTPIEARIATSCDEAADAADAGDGSVAPICDPSGASAVAPPRLLPVADARIEAVPTCGGETITVGPSIGPRGSDHPALSSPAVLEPVMLLDALLVPPAPYLESVDAPAPAGGPRAGVSNGVYHPPR